MVVKMSEKVISTHNIFIDTAKALDESGSKGDDFQLHLNTQSVDADRGQFIRLTLNQFSMMKTFTDVNDNNKAFYVYSVGGTGTNAQEAALDEQNYRTIHDLGTNFATKLGSILLSEVASAASSTVVSVSPSNLAGINGTTDNIITVVINFQNGAGATLNHGLTTLNVLFYESEGDIYSLLGGDSVKKSDPIAITSSISVDLTNAQNITFTCLYPAQRFTEPYLYLRTSLTTQSTETASLVKEDNVNEISEAQVSNILAKIPVNTEICVFTSNTGREYFIDLHQKHLNNIRFYLTDSRNRRIGRRPASGNLNTASGTGGNQSTRGNLNFSAVLRADIVQSLAPSQRLFEDTPSSVPARLTGLLLNPSI